jgi:zinc transport system ATP-binding protein
MTAIDPIIKLENVCFCYGVEEVLHNVSFAISDRDLVAVVGPNGGGKTTLLRLILGLEKPSRGTISVMGSTPAAARRRIGYAIQSLQYDPHFPVSCSEVVLMGRVERHRWGWYHPSDRKAADEALARVGMTAFSHKAFAQLSGGQRQRVIIARALACDPCLLLLDEPTANIDAQSEQRLFELFKTLNERITIVIVSHNVNVVTAYASHILCVNHTATLSPVGDLSPTKVLQGPGSEVAVIHHDLTCHVIDSSHVLLSDHKGDLHFHGGQEER